MKDAHFLINSCGGYYQAVKAILKFSRICWEYEYYKENDNKKQKAWNTLNYSHPEFIKEIRKSLGRRNISNIILSILKNNYDYNKVKKESWVEEYETGKYNVHPDVLSPINLSRHILKGIKNDADLRYYIIKDIREEYNCQMTSHTINVFYKLSKYINDKLDRELEGDSYYLDKSIIAQCYEHLNSSSSDNKEQTKHQQYVDCFFELCRYTGYMFAHPKKNQIRIKTLNIDSEFLLSNLFGLPTNIEGFDILFGGGGVLLPEGISDPNSDIKYKQILARTLAIVGECGSGKSILGLEIAVEVARKGGIAWVMPLEQEIEETLYTLESIQCKTTNYEFTIASDIKSMQHSLQRRNDNCGSLIILKPDARELEGIMDGLVDIAEDLPGNCIKLLVVDPINTLKIEDPQKQLILRNFTVEKLHKMKKSGTNILLIAESMNNSFENENVSASQSIGFTENISDTLIKLSVKKQYDYAQRVLEIKKSRMQREQRGEHVFSIVPGIGFRIYPSTASVNARLRQRRVKVPKIPIKFGLKGIDSIIGSEALYAGDIITLKGPSGSYKSIIGLKFLLAKRNFKNSTGKRPLSLLFDVKDSHESKNYLISKIFDKNQINYIDSGKEYTYDEIKSIVLDGNTFLKIITFPVGHVNPGRILQIVENEVENAQIQGYWVNRIMFDNINHWKISSPEINEDFLFADTLVELVRGIGATTLFVDGDEGNSSITGNANCIFQFKRFVFKGLNRITLKVLKTRGMDHRRETFEVSYSNDFISIKPSSSLLRFRPDTDVATPIKIRMLLHIGTSIQDRYYNSLCGSYKAIISENIEINHQDKLYKNNSYKMSEFSAVDELQIVQIDEFQMGMDDGKNIDRNNQLLHKFSGKSLDENYWSDFIPNSLKSETVYIKDKRIESFTGIPFIQNIGMLAFRNDVIDEKQLDSWGKIEKLSFEWEKKNETPGSDGRLPLFFDMPQVTPENYNCLFLEILLSLISKDSFKNEFRCPFRDLIKSDEALIAARIFHQLTKRSFQYNKSKSWIFPKNDKQRKNKPYRVDTEAFIWRHWYTTLNQMFEDCPKKLRSSIAITTLPKDISIAGEWYLGIPDYSAAPDAGLEIIKLMTSREAELARMRMGVGLPTKKSLYTAGNGEGSDSISISPYFSYDINKISNLLENAFRRSNFSCYFQISELLAFHVFQIIEAPYKSEDNNMIVFKEVFDDLEIKLNYIQEEKIANNYNCASCMKCKGLTKRWLKNI